MGERRAPSLWAVVAVLAIVIAMMGVPRLPARAASADASNPRPAPGSTVNGYPTLRWDPVPGTATYSVQIAADSAFSSLRFEAEVAAPSATPTVDLAPGTYYWRVQPHDASGQGSFGPTWSFDRAARSGPQATTPADGAVLDFPQQAPVLRWQPMNSATGYEVQWSSSDSFPTGSSTLTRLVASASYSLTDLEPQDRLTYWRVRGLYKTAYSKTGSTTTKTDWSTTRSFRTNWELGGATPNNSTPQLLTPQNDAAVAAAQTHPRFTWTPVAGAAKYRLQISAAPDFTDIRIDTDLAQPQYTGRGSLPDGAYYWRVAALDARDSAGPWSESFEFYRGWLDAQGLPARTSLSAEDEDPGTAGLQMSKDRFLVRWDPVPGASHYEVQIAAAANPAFTNTNTSQLMTCKTPNTALTPVFYGTYKRSDALSSCNFFRGSGSLLDLASQSTVYVRVRAVDKTTSSYPGGTSVSEVNSLYSDQARWIGDSAPGAFRVDLLATPAGDDVTAPAPITAPDHGSVHTGTPVLAWDRVPGATRYRVALSTDVGFTGSEVSSGTENYIVVTGTRLVMLEALKDNTAGQSLYWYVTPCKSWTSSNNNNNDCPVPDSAAINQAGKFRAFRKVSPTVAGLSPAPAASAIPEVTQSPVRLTWQDVLATEQASASPFKERAGSRYYEVEISREPDFDVADRLLLTTTDATELVPDVGWDFAETYFWRVRAIDGGGNSAAWSSSGAFIYRDATAPIGLTSTSGLPTPGLKWTPTPGAKAYEVEIYAGSNPTFPQASKVTSAVVQYPAWSPPTAATGSTPPAPLPAGDYSWRVRKLDTTGTAGAWNDSSGGVPQFTVGAASPTLTAPAASATTPLRGLRFEWAPVAGAAEYVVQVSTSSSDFSSVTGDYTTTTAGTAWTPTLGSGTSFPAGTYYWRVQAISTAATGQVLATSAVRGVNVVTPPGEPSSLSAAVVGPGAVGLNWTPPTTTGNQPITGYRIWTRRSAGDWVEIPPSAANAGARSISGLAKNTDYEFRVAARNSVGTGPSRTVDATTPGEPAAPRRLSVSAIDRGFTARWYTPSSSLPLLRYRVRYRPAGASTWTSLTTTDTTATRTGLLPNRRYDVQVAGVNAVGTGPYATFSVVTLASPSAPRSFTATAGTGSATLRWLSPASPGSSAVTRYTVSYRTAGASDWSTRSVSTTGTTLSGLSVGQQYQVFVKARNAVGLGQATPTLTVTPR